MTYVWFYQMVRNHGPWDFKQGRAQYANFGNFHFGAVGAAAGIPDGVLLRGAGAAQWICPYKSRQQNTLKLTTHAGDDTHVVSDIPAHCGDAVHYSVRRQRQG